MFILTTLAYVIIFQPFIPIFDTNLLNILNINETGIHKPFMGKAAYSVSILTPLAEIDCKSLTSLSLLTLRNYK